MRFEKYYIIILCALVACLYVLSMPLPEANASFPGQPLISANLTTPNTSPTSDPLTSSEVLLAPLKELPVSSNPSISAKNYLVELQLFLEDFTLRAYWRIVILDINKNRLIHDVQLSFQNLATLSGFSSILELLGFLGIVFLLAIIVEWLIKFTFLRNSFKSTGTPSTRYHSIKLTMAKFAKQSVSIVIFSVASYISYILIYSTYFSIICPVYLSTLVTIIIIRLFSILLDVPIAHNNQTLRFFSWNNSTAKTVYISASIFVATLTISIVTTILLKYGGLDGDSLIWVKLIFGTAIILTTGVIVFVNRKTITNTVSSGFVQNDNDEKPDLQHSYIWFSMVVIYLFVLWVILGGKLLLSESHSMLPFLISLMIIPLFLILDSFIGWLFSFVTKALSGDTSGITDSQEPPKPSAKPNIVAIYLRTLSRILLVFFLLLWILSLWDIHFSYTTLIISSIRKVAAWFIVFFFVWQIIDKSIGNLLAQKESHAQEEDGSGESEWGEGQLLDRSQTLLPIVRKFLGIVMFVMLSLFTLSSLGVNIGPLLAGAGVMGIAIGFGAQKLVSDLLSGFFYLVDDAFRVGEYIEAGSITGTVEKITLRNLMLRHHRGMLQIVPYSDLGAITNYMRGGIVVKFNLQFPYDTDVDLVRKIVKRVGIEMLKDPEFGNNFIKQMKSQGIREVGDSILTIRVKFTANPGTHFVIRREAYLRITEALNAKGIYYAHRKVIVDFPESRHQEMSDPATREKLLKAGAASTLVTNGKPQE